MRFLKSVLVLLLCLTVGGYFVANHYLTKTTRRLLPEAKSVAQDYGVHFDTLSVGGAKISSLSSLSWKNLQGTFTLRNISGIKPDKPFTFSLDSLTVGLRELTSGDFYAQLKGLELKTAAKAQAADHTEQDTYVSSDNVQSGSIVLTEALYPFAVGRLSSDTLKNPRKVLENLKSPLAQFKKAMSKGVLPEELQLEGRVEISLRNSHHEIRLVPTEVKDKRVVQLNREDLATASKDFYTRLSKPEVELVAQYPLRAPRLLQVKYQSEQAANAEFGGSADSPSSGTKDAFQYITWSYLLTVEYDDAFAKKITDAHEAEVPDQGSKERNMDLRNASLGREYARKGVPYASLRKKMEADPRVIRSF